jgi:hypothetical protein
MITEFPMVEISLHEFQAPILAELLQTPEYEWGQELDRTMFQEGIMPDEVVQILDVISSIREQLEEAGIPWTPPED